MKLHSFHELATRIAHLSTRDGKGVSVTFSGTDAFTDGKRVNLPALPSGTVLTPHQFSVWLGYTLHEGPGHLTHTDMAAYTHATQSRNNPVFSSILNILEDVRIENADIALYPGDRKHLDLTHHYVDNQIPIEKCQNPDQIALIYKSAYSYRNLDTGKIQGRLIGPMAEALKTLPLCRSTSDCINLAEKITELLKESPSQQEQQHNEQERTDQNFTRTNSETTEQNDGTSAPEKEEAGLENTKRYSRNNPSPDPEGGEGESVGRNQEENHGEGSENNPSDGTEPQTERQSGDSHKDSSSSSSSLPSSAREWQELTEVKNLVKSLIENINDFNSDPRPTPTPPHTGNLCLPPADLSLDRVFVPSEEDLPQYLYTRSLLAPQITALKKMFRVHLQSRSKKSWLRGLEEGETLDAERLHVTAFGQGTVFKDKHDRRLINTAVELMLDLSSSMDESLVRSAAIILSEALNTIPEIKLSICGFKTNRSMVNDLPIYGDFSEFSSSGRVMGMDILVFKDYHESYIHSRPRLGAIETQNLTPLGDAYGKALEHILPRSEPRRIIFLVTDGQPKFKRGNLQHSDYILMSRIHHKCQRLKVETLGLAIGPEQTVGFLKPYVDKCVRIEQIGDLPRTLLQVLKGIVR